MTNSDPWEGYFQSLGYFVHKLASVESMLFVQLVAESEIPISTAQEIFTNAGIHKTKDKISRIIKAKGQEMSEVLKRAFDQLGIITRVRNDILHCGALQVGNTLIVNNHLFANKPEKLRRTEVSSEILKQMTADLNTIQACFAVHSLTGVAPQSFINQGFGPASQAPWRYKQRKPSA